MSFRYGDFEGKRNGRYFTDYRTKTLKELIIRFSNLELVEIKRYDEMNPENEDTEWIYALIRKIDAM